MMGLTAQTKKEVLNLFLKTSTKRMVEINNSKKIEPHDPCFACIKAYLNSVKSS